MLDEQKQYNELYGTWEPVQCPHCSSNQTMYLSTDDNGLDSWYCEDCEWEWLYDPLTAQNDS